jgi:DNA adenine methylase
MGYDEDFVNFQKIDYLKTNSLVIYMAVTKPILKWVGGKTQIIDQVLEAFPTEIKDYYEPFLGGGSVLLAFLSYVKRGKIQLSGKVIASDLNSRLVGVYKNIQSHVEEVIVELNKLKEEYERCEDTATIRKPKNEEEAKTSSESWYYWKRQQYNALKDDDLVTPQATALFIFLNKTCFRGVYREGPNGFNVPYGHYKNPAILDETHLKEVANLIKDVEFRCCSYQVVLSNVEKGDFVYLDPPYAPENSKSFVGYTKDGFDLDNHKKLFELCKEMTNKSILHVMSNADVELVREYFTEEFYDIEVISCRRAINAKKPASRTNEVLVKLKLQPC